MNEKIKNREIHKSYLTIVCGKPSPAAARLENQLFKDASKNIVIVKKHAEPGTKTAVTEYQTLAVKDGLALLSCQLITGRTHQIRAQLANIGTPLLGDGKYGREKCNNRYHEKGQLLCSYLVEIQFETDAGVLNYLNGKSFRISSVDFVEKYFPGTVL